MRTSVRSLAAAPSCGICCTNAVATGAANQSGSSSRPSRTIGPCRRVARIVRPLTGTGDVAVRALSTPLPATGAGDVTCAGKGFLLAVNIASANTKRLVPTRTTRSRECMREDSARERPEHYGCFGETVRIVWSPNVPGSLDLISSQIPFQVGRRVSRERVRDVVGRQSISRPHDDAIALQVADGYETLRPGIHRPERLAITMHFVGNRHRVRHTIRDVDDDTVGPYERRG